MLLPVCYATSSCRYTGHFITSQTNEASKNCELSASCELYLRHITLVTRPEDEHISGTRKQITTSKQESKGPSWRLAEKVSALSCSHQNCLTLHLGMLNNRSHHPPLAPCPALFMNYNSTPLSRAHCSDCTL